MPKKPTCSKHDIPGNTCRIYHGDCVDVLPRLSVKADLIFADPPYHLRLKQELYRPNKTRVDGVDDAWDQFASNAEYDAFTEK